MFFLINNTAILFQCFEVSLDLFVAIPRGESVELPHCILSLQYLST